LETLTPALSLGGEGVLSPLSPRERVRVRVNYIKRFAFAVSAI
jgi:hypothetical protein